MKTAIDFARHEWRGLIAMLIGLIAMFLVARGSHRRGPVGPFAVFIGP